MNHPTYQEVYHLTIGKKCGQKTLTLDKFEMNPRVTHKLCGPGKAL